jgi:hypothetical protein
VGGQTVLSRPSADSFAVGRRQKTVSGKDFSPMYVVKKPRGEGQTFFQGGEGGAAVTEGWVQIPLTPSKCMYAVQ